MPKPLSAEKLANRTNIVSALSEIEKVMMFALIKYVETVNSIEKRRPIRSHVASLPLTAPRQ